MMRRSRTLSREVKKRANPWIPPNNIFFEKGLLAPYIVPPPWKQVEITHPVHELQLEDAALPPINTDKADRMLVVQLLNNLSIKNVLTALELLFKREAGMAAPDSIEIVVGQEVSKCSRANRACTNGKTIWISLAMFEGDNAPTEREIGFKLPPSVRPGTIVVLHEFAHLLMGHPYNTVTTTDVKEKRADAWVENFVSVLW